MADKTVQIKWSSYKIASNVRTGIFGDATICYEKRQGGSYTVDLSELVL